MLRLLARAGRSLVATSSRNPRAIPATELARLGSAHFDSVEVTVALQEAWQLVRALNRYVQEQAPWQLAKDPSASDRLDSILYGLAEGLRAVSVLLHPFLPDSSTRLLAALGREELSFETAIFGHVGGGARVEELEPLFPRVERAEA